MAVPWPTETQSIAQSTPPPPSRPPAAQFTDIVALARPAQLAALPIAAPVDHPDDSSDTAAPVFSSDDLDDPLVEKAALTAALDTAGPAHPDDVAEQSDPPGVKIVEVQKGDTLLDILLGSGIKSDEAAAAIDALDSLFKPRDLKPGQAITLALDRQSGGEGDGGVQLASLSLDSSVERNVVVKRDDNGGFVAAAIVHPLQLQDTLASGVIDSSLFEAGQDAAVPVEVMSQVIKAFSYDVDFQREVQPGDRFEILYERYEDEHGRLARPGNVLYAALILSGTTKEIYRYEPQDGVADFFNAQGESIRKDLLRTPLDVIRISSSFGMRRDPILGYSRMHRGVDFAASMGTPIFAAGNGIIARIGPVNGYGNYIQIKHNPQYATAYGHMSRFASGLRIGSKVRQGDVIGYVGMTGRATGPHLHYEVLVNGSQINPMSVKLTGHKLDGKDLRLFEAMKVEMKTIRRHLGSPVLVARQQER